VSYPRANYENINAEDVEAINGELEALKCLFAAFKQLLNPSYRGVSNHWNHIWSKLRSLLIRNGDLDPVRYMEAQFDAIGRTLQPNELISSKAVARYYKYKIWHRQEVELCVKLYTEKVKSRLFCHFELESILMDRLEELSPLFRVIIASDSKLDAVCNEFMDEAVSEYVMGRPDFDVVYKEAIPKEVKCRADQIFRQTKKKS